MKIALCLYGYFNNRDDNDAGFKGYNYINNNILSISKDLDIFIYTWETEMVNKIIDLYHPKKIISDEQIDFNVIAKKNEIDENWINEGFNRNVTIYKQCTIHASLSFFYSRMKSIDLKKTFEIENNFKYDCVIVARFDLGHRSQPHVGGYNVSLMPFQLDLDLDYIYSAMWLQLNAGYADQWFISNSKNIDLLGTMYEKALHEYFQSNSEYYNTITTGWFDSNIKNEFSNEYFLKNKSTNLVKYPKWQIINNHILHKWHLYKVGLYEKSKFL